ncbi:MAG: hypothetical protein ACRDI2_13490 [Chloroflexota bacterium]
MGWHPTTDHLELTDEQRAELERMAEDLAGAFGYSKAYALDAIHRCLRAESPTPMELGKCCWPGWVEAAHP